MITALANRIVDFIYANTELSEEQREIYIYGYEIIISSAVTFILLVMTGLIFGRLPESIIFFLVFYILRQKTGGYHAETYLKCNLIFEINIILVMLLTLIDFSLSVLIAVNIAAYVLCIAAILILAPIENINKPIPADSRQKFKIMALVLAFIFEIASICLLKYDGFSLCISMAMASTAFAMIINQKERNKTHEKKCNRKGCGKIR